MPWIRATNSHATLVLAAIAFAFSMTTHDAAADSGSFESTWDIKGSARKLEFGPSRMLRTVRHTGTITFRSSKGFVGTVMTSCIGLHDTGQRDIGRCTWVTGDGERLYSELTGSLPPGLDTGTASGVFVGGTGRFTGVTGSYQLDWVARPSLEPDAFGAQTVRMTGSWTTP
jgi:hypothetical protein